jgi:Uma2 family endonuclease
MATATRPLAAMPEEQHRLSLDDYRRMIAAEVLGPDDRIELLDGLLVKKMPKGPRHATATTKVYKRLIQLLPDGWTVRQEQPLELPDGPEGGSAPEPDIAIVRGSDDDYGARHPGPEDVALVIQFADAEPSRERKNLVRFGWSRVREVWIVDLGHNELTVHTVPTGPCDDPGYGTPGPALADRVTPLWIALDNRPCGPLLLGELLG